MRLVLLLYPDVDGETHDGQAEEQDVVAVVLGRSTGRCELEFSV